MDKLENRIRKERDALDSFEPSDGHMDRFADKLDSRYSGIFARIHSGVKIAAAVLVLLASGILIYTQAFRFLPGQKYTDLNEMSSEFSEAEYYYVSQIREIYSAIDRFAPNDPEQKRILMTELNQMDSMFDSLQKDLRVNPTDERILHAMINHYQLKLEVMGQILTHLEKVQQNTNNNHESTDI